MAKKPKMSSLATILDIARIAKVSPSTVSRALREETVHLVRPDKLKRIHEVMDTVNYSPSRLARGLRNSQTKTINLIVNYSPNVFQTEIVPRLIAGITEVLVDSGYELKLCMQRERASLMKLREYFTDSDGIIYASHRLSGEELEFLKSRSKDCVVLEDCIPVHWPIEKCGFSTVGITNEDGCAEMVRHLIKSGHRKIAFVKGLADSRDAEERYKGYMRAMNEAKIDIEPRWIIQGDFMEESGREAIRVIHRQLPEITACVFASDEMAVGALDEAKLLGLQLPKDFSIAGYDNTRLSRFCWPKLTTVDQPREVLGESAARCLLEQIRSDGFKVQHMRIPHELHLRESTGAPRKS
jgi:DNA-binding LacI/PurR family transcriptional regulator